MTDRELFEKVLEAMEHLHRTGDTQVFDLCYAPELIPALKERLAQPETVMAEYKHQTYAAYKTDGEMKIGVLPEHEPAPTIDKSAARRIATALGWEPRREWVGLTAAEFRRAVDGLEDLEDCWAALEHALKEKNT